MVFKHVHIKQFYDNMSSKPMFILFNSCNKLIGNIKCHRILISSRDFTTQARVVITGAGIVANSVAYHLVQNGWHDILVLEQNRIGSGTSHFGSGMLGLFKPLHHRNIIQYSLKLYQQLQDMGYDVELKQCGSLNLAQTKDRVIALKRRIAYNIPTGLHCQLITPNELKNLHPHLRTDDLEAAVWVPEDAVANPKAICSVLAGLAQQGGAKYIENTIVEEVLTKNCSIYAVKTDKGIVNCEYFINCAGMWARELGLNCKPPVQIPAYPAEHFYGTTGYVGQGIDDLLPCVRDLDAHTNAREYQGGFMVGWFEPEAKPAFECSQVPRDWLKHLKKDFKHFLPLWAKAINRIPILQECKNVELVNSPDNFTPDGLWIVGESAEVNNYFVACGMNGNSLQGAGGIGKAVAEWVIEGEPTQDLLPFSIQRFLDVHNGRYYLRQRTKEIVGRHYAVLYPHQCEYKYARNLRCSPLYSVLETRGAVFGIRMAYERALYFDTTYKRGDPYPQMPPGTFYKPKFFDFMKDEFQVCKEGVGIIDMSSFSKIEIKSDGLNALNYLQNLCSNDIDISVGSIVRTGMHNERGGYENDCMLVRQAENSFFMVSPTSQQTRIYEWMTRHLEARRDSTVHVTDVTSMYTVINVVGPKARELLSELSNSNVKLPPLSYKKVNVGYASDVMVMSFTHTGEAGYCLYIPSEYALHIYYRLLTVGRDYGIRDVGVLTQRFMRIERFIPFWAEELLSFTTPYEAGNGYSVKLDKKHDFIGKRALQKQKDAGIKKRLMFFHLNDIDPDKDIWPWGGEPIYRNNEYVGTVTSAGYGFCSDRLICLGYIHLPSTLGHQKTIHSDFLFSKDAVYEIDIAGQRFSCTGYLRAPSLVTAPVQGHKYKPTVVSDIIN